MSSETRQKSILPCSSDAIMSALRGLLAEIRAQQHSSLRLHFRRIATSNSPGLGSSEFRVPVPWGFIAGQGENYMLLIKVIATELGKYRVCRCGWLVQWLLTSLVWLILNTRASYYFGKVKPHRIDRCHQEWGEELSSSSKPPWIVLHGWLDNSGSFNGLAPLFRERGHRLLCIDLPGTAANNLFCFIDWLITWRCKGLEMQLIGFIIFREKYVTFPVLSMLVNLKMAQWIVGC